MQVQIHTDSHIQGSEAMAQWASQAIKSGLTRFSGQLAHVEAHLSDINGGKKTSPENLQCVLEARLDGHPPQVVKNQAANLNQAIDGALSKLERLLGSTLEKARP